MRDWKRVWRSLMAMLRRDAHEPPPPIPDVASAQFRLGNAYDTDDGMGKDPVEAVRWWREAAERGHAGARLRLGFAYRLGEGVARNPAEAVRWWRQAALQGDADAQYLICRAYRTGDGVAQDAEEALRWLRRAAEQGHARARHEVFPEEAVGQLRVAPEQGHAVAQFLLGKAYHDGVGVPKGPAEAARWYRKAAEQGHAVAQYTLGRAYENGEGVPRDEAEAQRWYRKAAAQRDADAHHAQAGISGTLSPEDQEFIAEHLAEARVFRKYGLHDKARDQFEAVLARFPYNVEALGELAEAFKEKATDRRRG